MRSHSTSCQYCADITTETIEMRESIAGISKEGPSVDFEVNLNRRIHEMTYGKRRASRAKLPRWAALGAGLATGLAIGIVILLPANQDNMDQYADNQVEEVPMLVVDTTTYDSDSSNIVNEPYRLDDRSKLVSGK